MGPEVSAARELLDMTIEWVNIFGDLGAMGLVIWLVVWVTKHTIPRLAKTFEAGMDKARDDFKGIMAEQRADFFKAIQDQNAFFAEMRAKEHEKQDVVFKFLREYQARGELHGQTNNN